MPLEASSRDEMPDAKIGSMQRRGVRGAVDQAGDEHVGQPGKLPRHVQTTDTRSPPLPCLAVVYWPTMQ
jgi:hypothetical protein